MESLKLHGWLPISVYQRDGQWRVDWCWFGTQRLLQPFFREAVDDALRLPFNQAFRRETPLSTLSEWQQESPGLTPSAFIYHASRCGSTLISQMLAQLDSHVLISEPPALDTLLRCALPEDQRRAAIEGLLSAYGQVRVGGEQALVIKLDAWNVFERPLLREYFPQVPWLYLYRDPLEIAVSHLRRAGMQMIPGMLGVARLEGQQPFSGREDDVARRVGELLAGGLEQARQESVLLVNYHELPQAMAGRLGRFFQLDADQVRLALGAAGRHAKSPGQAFVPDSQEKHKEASVLLHERVGHWALAAYAGLEQERLRQR